MRPRERIAKRFIWNFLAPHDYFYNNPPALMAPGATATGAASKPRDREGKAFTFSRLSFDIVREPLNILEIELGGLRQ
jgi:hypothetical protein